MAINPSSKYPGQTTTPDADYPYGGARNDITLDDGTGTPLEEAWLNDWFGFSQYVLKQAAIIPSGSPETAQVSQIADAISGRPRWIGPEKIGAELTITGAGYPAICPQGGVAGYPSPAIAYFDSATQELRRYTIDSIAGVFVLDGSGLSIAVAGDCGLARLSANNVALILDGDNTLRRYSWGGSSYSASGNALTIASLSRPAICALSSSRVAVVDAGTNTLRAYDFDGTDWAQVGNAITVDANLDYCAICSTSSDTVVVSRDGRELKRYVFDGTDWTLEGTLVVQSVDAYPAIVALNSTDVMHWYPIASDSLIIYRFNGTTGTNAFTAQTYSAEFIDVGVGAMCALNGTDIAYIGSNNEKLGVLRCAFYTGPSPFYA